MGVKELIERNRHDEVGSPDGIVLLFRKDVIRLLDCLERAVEGWTETYICSHCRGGGLEPPETTELPGDREDCHQCDGYGITINGESSVQFRSSLDRIAAKERTE